MPLNFQFGSFHCIALTSIYPLSFELIGPGVITSLHGGVTVVDTPYLLSCQILITAYDGEYYHRLILQMRKGGLRA